MSILCKPERIYRYANSNKWAHPPLKLLSMLWFPVFERPSLHSKQQFSLGVSCRYCVKRWEEALKYQLQDLYWFFLPCKEGKDEFCTVPSGAGILWPTEPLYMARGCQVLMEFSTRGPQMQERSLHHWGDKWLWQHGPTAHLQSRVGHFSPQQEKVAHP